MNLDELKTAWQNLDRKLQATRMLNEQIIVTMIADRSQARFDVVRRNYRMGFGGLFICFIAGIAVLLGNPFDYQYNWQYIPMLIYCVCLVFIAGKMILSYNKLGKVKLDHINIRIALKSIVGIHEEPQKFMKYLLYVFLFSQTILFPLSFLPKSIERAGLWPALFERLIPISIAILMLYVAHRLGAFKERHVEKFREDLNELDRLKAMAAELENEKV